MVGDLADGLENLLGLSSLFCFRENTFLLEEDDPEGVFFAEGGGRRREGEEEKERVEGGEGEAGARFTQRVRVRSIIIGPDDNGWLSVNLRYRKGDFNIYYEW